MFHLNSIYFPVFVIWATQLENKIYYPKGFDPKINNLRKVARTGRNPRKHR
jgi:hypothetical protein